MLILLKFIKMSNIKVILVGMTSVGKTNMINILSGMQFQTSILSTTSSSYVEKKMNIDNKKYNLQIWDTAGQEKFRSLTKIFIKDSRIVIFVYDISSKKSFEEVDYWVNIVKEILGDKPVFGLAGNKKDLFFQEEVDEKEGIKKAEEIGAIFKLTSAKTKYGINELMEQLLREYIRKLKDGEIDYDNNCYKLDNKISHKKRKCCNK